MNVAQSSFFTKNVGNHIRIQRESQESYLKIENQKLKGIIAEKIGEIMFEV